MRRITEHDIPQIIDMTKALGRESPVYGQYAQHEWYVSDQLLRMFHYEDFIGFIEDDKGFMFGTAGSAWYSPRKDFYENLLYIRPEHRGGMLAARLIRATEKAARSIDCKVFWAGASTGLEENKTLVLYERLGFKRTSQGVYKELTECVQELNS